MKASNLLKSLLLPLALMTTATSQAAIELIPMVEGENYTLIPSTDEVQASLKGKIYLILDEPAYRSSTTVLCNTPSGETVRMKVNDVTSTKNVIELPYEFTDPGEYVFTIDSYTWYFGEEEDSANGVIKFTYTVGEPKTSYQLTPAPGNVMDISKITISFEGSKLGIAANPKGTLTSDYGIVYDLAFSQDKDGNVVVTCDDDTLPYIGYELKVDKGSITVDGEVFDKDIYGVYKLLSPEPDVIGVVTPAPGVVDKIQKFRVKWTKPDGKTWNCSVDEKASTAQYPHLYTVDDDGSLTYIDSAFALSFYRNGSELALVVSTDSEGKEYVHIPSFDEIGFNFMEIAAPGRYVIIFPADGLVIYEGKQLHHDIMFGEWVIERPSGLDYKVVTNPENGATVSTIDKVTFTYEGIKEIEYGYRNLNVYYTNLDGKRVSYTSFRFGYGTAANEFVVDFNLPNWYGEHEEGLYEINIPAGFFTLTMADGSTCESEGYSMHFLYLKNDLPEYTGDYLIERELDDWHYLLTFLGAKTIKTFDTANPIKIVDSNGNLVTKRSEVTIGREGQVNITFHSVSNIPAGDYTLVIPEGYFLVDGALSGEMQKSIVMTSIEEIMAADATVDVYTLSGVRALTGAGVDQLKDLAPGLYIVHDGVKAIKVLVK